METTTTSDGHDTLSVLRETIRGYDGLVQRSLRILDEEEQVHRELGIEYHKISKAAREGTALDSATSTMLRRTFTPASRTSTSDPFNTVSNLSKVVVKMCKEIRMLTIPSGTAAELRSRLAEITKCVKQAGEAHADLKDFLDFISDCLTKIHAQYGQQYDYYWEDNMTVDLCEEWYERKAWVETFPEVPRLVESGLPLDIVISNIFYPDPPDGFV